MSFFETIQPLSLNILKKDHPFGRALAPKKVQEILENWKDFADYCSLKPLERRRAMAASSGRTRCFFFSWDEFCPSHWIGSSETLQKTLMIYNVFILRENHGFPGVFPPTNPAICEQKHSGYNREISDVLILQHVHVVLIIHDRKRKLQKHDELGGEVCLVVDG